MPTSHPSSIRPRLQAAGLVLALAPLAAFADPRGFTADDLVRLDRVSNPMLSPDASQIAFVVREADFDANKARTSIWLQPFAGGEAERLTAEDSSASSPQWGPGGRSLFFVSSRSGKQQVWRLDLDGGEAVQVTDYPFDVGSYRVSPDGRALAFSLEVFPDCPDLACNVERLAERADDKATGVLHDQLFVRHWDRWKDGRLNQLFVARLDGAGRATGEPNRVTRMLLADVPSKPFGGSSDFVWSPDGMSIVFAARLSVAAEPWTTNFDLYQATLDGPIEPRNLTEANPAADVGPLFSTDGRTLYYRAMQRPGFEADRYAVMALDLATGERREIAPDWDRSPGSMELSEDGRTLFVTAYDRGTHALFALDIADGDARRITDEGAISGFDVARNRLVFARDSLVSPAHLFATDLRGREPRQLTDFNADRLADVRMGAYEQFSFPGWNDETVYGYVVKPWNWQEDGEYPVAFIIHGGPQGSMGNSFHYRWNPQTYAGQGIAVVFIDFHGSTGYGQAFTDAISGDWGGKPLVDLQKGWQAALEKYPFLDGDRACALGASYGGYMVNWIAGTWNEPWDCFVNHAGVFDLRSMGYSTEELWFTEWEFGGTPWDVPENYERFNPVRHVENWRVPMLVIHGQLDFRVPVEQGIAAFTALQRRGIDSKFLYYPDENHWILTPQNSVQWHNTVNAWLHQYLK